MTSVRLSVRPSQHGPCTPLLQVCCCEPGGQEISIDYCSSGVRWTYASSATLSANVGSWKQKQTGKLPSCRSSTEAHNVLTTCPRSLCESKTPESRQLQVQRVHITIDALSCPCCTRRFRFRQTHTLEWLWNWIGASELGTLCTDSSFRGRCKV